MDDSEEFEMAREEVSSPEIAVETAENTREENEEIFDDASINVSDTSSASENTSAEKLISEIVEKAEKAMDEPHERKTASKTVAEICAEIFAADENVSPEEEEEATRVAEIPDSTRSNDDNSGTMNEAKENEEEDHIESEKVDEMQAARKAMEDLNSKLDDLEREIEKDEVEDDSPLDRIGRWKGENAVSIAIDLLREGREIQKISVIRNLSEIMEAHPEECATELLPVVQDILQESSASLDLHCEGAIAYRNILTDKSLLEIDTNISQQVLQGALAIFSHAPEDSYPFVAWTETLLEIADNLTEESFRTEILPVAVAQSQPSRPVKSRIASIKLLEKLAAKLSPNEVKTNVVPCVQSLCQDVNAQVRASICERLPTIAKTLNSVEYKMVILPLMVELCNDEDLSVQERALDSIRNSLPYFDKETVRNVVVPLFKRSAEKSMQICDTNLAVISKNLGPWIYEIFDVITDEQKSWFLVFFTRLAQLGTASQSASTNVDLMTRSDPEGFSFNNPFDSDPVQVACRDWCAYNFPGMVQMFGVGAFQSQLLPVFTKLCQDSEEGIRKTVAAGFHEIVKILDKTTCMSDMISSFIDLIRLGDPEVVGNLTANLGAILPKFYEHFARMEANTSDDLDANGNIIQKKTQLNRILLACNRLIRNNSNWRAHEDFLKGISCLVKCPDSFDDMHLSFIPLLKEEILTTRAIPCRIAAVRTLLMFMRYATSKKSRISIIEFFIQTLAHHQSCHKRSLFLDVCREVLELYSRYFFKKHFLQEAIKLLDDKIPNVRIKAFRLFPLMKKAIILPLDEPMLSSMEAAVKKLLVRDQSPREFQAAQQAAKELSMAETGEIEDQSDRKKLSQEFERFGSPELVASCHEFHSSASQRQRVGSPGPSAGAKPPTTPTPSTTDTNSLLPPPTPGVRIRKPRTAIVRPQPKLIVTRSPSPRPDKENQVLSPEKENSGRGLTSPTKHSSKRMSQSASESDLKSTNLVSGVRRSTMLRPPTPVTSPRRGTTGESRQNDSPRPSGPRPRPYRTGSVRQAAQKWESNPNPGRSNTPLSFDQNGNNNLMRFNSSSYEKDPNSNSSSSFSPRSSIPIASYMRRGSLPGQNGGNNLTEKKSADSVSSQDRDQSLPRRSYGLMKVQSASAIQQSSASTFSMRARRKF